MKTIWHDIRYGLRQLHKSPGFTVIGVMPRHFIGPLARQSRADLYVPLTAQRQLLPDARWLEKDYVWWIQIMGRLARGADEAYIQASLEPLFCHVVNRSEVKISRPGSIRWRR